MTQPATSNQATDLMGYLTKQREHVLGILENLPERHVRRPVLPDRLDLRRAGPAPGLDVRAVLVPPGQAGEQVEPDEFGLMTAGRCAPKSFGRGRAGPCTGVR